MKGNWGERQFRVRRQCETPGKVSVRLVSNLLAALLSISLNYPLDCCLFPFFCYIIVLNLYQGTAHERSYELLV